MSFCQGLFSSVVCPGLVMTNLTYGILPSFFWTLIMPIMWLVSWFFSLCLFYLPVWTAHILCFIWLELLTGLCGILFLVLIRFESSPTRSHSHHTTEQLHWYVCRQPMLILKEKVFKDLYLYSEWIINMKSCSDLSQHWLFLQKPESLDPRAKYHSLTSGLGTSYTQPRQVTN